MEGGWPRVSEMYSRRCELVVEPHDAIPEGCTCPAIRMTDSSRERLRAPTVARHQAAFHELGWFWSAAG